MIDQQNAAATCSRSTHWRCLACRNTCTCAQFPPSGRAIAPWDANRPTPNVFHARNSSTRSHLKRACSTKRPCLHSLRSPLWRTCAAMRHASLPGMRVCMSTARQPLVCAGRVLILAWATINVSRLGASASVLPPRVLLRSGARRPSHACSGPAWSSAAPHVKDSVSSCPPP